jgi:signal transduction histidine kinase
MRRLYVRIYLALLASLIVFGLLAGVTVAVFRRFDTRPREPWPQTGVEIAERLLPPGRDPAALASDLAFWSEHSGFALALVRPDGAVIAQAGEMPFDFPQELRRHPRRDRLWRWPGGVYGLTLNDGRLLIAAPPPPAFGIIHFLRVPALFLGLGLAVAIGFYPLIRQLLRRLEILEAGVERFGEGDFSARVSVSGRDEVAKLASTFNASADRIEHLLKAHKMLLAQVSHELRSPLSRLRMAVERLEGSGGDEQANYEARRNIGELDALVDEILLSSRLQAGALRLSLEPVDVAGLLAEECAAYGADFTLTGAVPAPISGDGRLLRRLFRNLLDNAKTHGGPLPPEVTLSSGEGGIRIAICDRGPGIPEAEREKIFEPFYQVQSRHSPGVGLGLSLVREIALRHGGAVRLLPPDGGGACFEVCLPILPQPGPEKVWLR